MGHRTRCDAADATQFTTSEATNGKFDFMFSRLDLLIYLLLDRGFLSVSVDLYLG